MTHGEPPPRAQATNASASEPSSQPRTRGRERTGDQAQKPRQSPSRPRPGTAPANPNRPDQAETTRTSQKRARKIPATASKQHGQGDDIGRVANFSTSAGTRHDQGQSQEFRQISQVGKESQRVTGCNAIRARAREPPPEMSLREIPSGRGESAGNGNVALLAHMRESPLGNAIARNPKWGQRVSG